MINNNDNKDTDLKNILKDYYKNNNKINTKREEKQFNTMVVGKSEGLFCLDSNLSLGTNSNANINKNNEYIPPKEDNNNKGMIKTLQDIIKKKQKVKVHGNTFDFSNYNEKTKKVSINGTEIQVNQELLATLTKKTRTATDTINLTHCQEKFFTIYLDGQTYTVSSINIYPDLTIKSIESPNVEVRNSHLNMTRNIFYTINDNNITGTTNNNNITIDFSNNNDYIYNEEYTEENTELSNKIKSYILTTEEQKKLFDYFYNNKVKNNSSYRDSIYLTFYKNKLYVQQVNNNPKLLCIERQFDKNAKKETFTEKEYNLNNIINDKEEIVGHIFPIEDNQFVIKYHTMNQAEKQQKGIAIYEKKIVDNNVLTLAPCTKQILDTTDDERDYICYNKEEPNKMFSKGDNFDKQLKKYFDKCVREEQKKEKKMIMKNENPEEPKIKKANTWGNNNKISLLTITQKSNENNNLIKQEDKDKPQKDEDKHLESNKNYNNNDNNQYINSQIEEGSLNKDNKNNSRDKESINNTAKINTATVALSSSSCCNCNSCDDFCDNTGNIFID